MALQKEKKNIHRVVRNDVLKSSTLIILVMQYIGV